MKLFKLIHGNKNNIADFENKVSEAMEEGYILGSDLIVKTVEQSNKPVEILLFQPMSLEDQLDFEDHLVDNDDETDI